MFSVSSSADSSEVNSKSGLLRLDVLYETTMLTSRGNLLLKNVVSQTSERNEYTAVIGALVNGNDLSNSIGGVCLLSALQSERLTAHSVFDFHAVISAR